MQVCGQLQAYEKECSQPLNRATFEPIDLRNALYRQMIANTMIDTNQLCLLQLLFHISLQPALTALLHTNSHPKQGVWAGPWKGS